MGNYVHPNSKQAMCAFARKAIAGIICVLREAGMSYQEIEGELRLHPRNGMTVWDYVNKPKKK